MDYNSRRHKIFDLMQDNDLLILYSGKQTHISVDAYFPFEVNRQFFYLTGINQQDVILVMHKGKNKKTTIFTKKVDPLEEKWNGKQLTVEQVSSISNIQDVKYLDEFDGYISRLMMSEEIRTVFFDTYKHQLNDLDDYNLVMAKKFQLNYPHVAIQNIYNDIAKLRMQKDEDEVNEIKNAIDITKSGLLNILDHLQPNMYEYQVQANFEYQLKYMGATTSFDTIAGSGYNGTMLHYVENNSVCQDGDLILLDLGAKINGYCADISRTYPINGKFSQRQKEIYNIVLEANLEVIKHAKAGMTLYELNEICKNVLSNGLMKIGLISNPNELSKYYMHGVSHHLGIDVHDASVISNNVLKPGAIITDEPGLYIEEESIGIRIEDDLLITEDGCIVLSQGIIKTVDEIEEYMESRKKHD